MAERLHRSQAKVVDSAAPMGSAVVSMLPSTLAPRGTVGLLASCLAALACSCESGRVSPSGEPLPALSPAPVRSAAPTRAPARRSAEPVPSGPAKEVKLEGGGSLQLPPGTTAVRSPRELPGIVKQAHNFKLAGGKRRLMVSELALEGQPCSERLDEEWKRIQESRKDTDPERGKLRRVTSVQQRTVAGRRVVYSESMQGTSLVDAGKPFAAVASVMTCTSSTLLLIMFVSNEPQLDPSVRQMLDDVVASYRPPADAGR